MKTNTIIYITIGVLLIVAIVSYVRYNKVSKSTKTSNILGGGTSTKPKPASSVSAGQLAQTLRENMNGVKELNVQFYDNSK